jgi:hypothetical protein
VGLTGEERQRLDQLAAQLERDDPRLVRRLSGRRRRPGVPRLPSWVAVGLLGAAMPLLVVAVIVEQPALFAAGGVAMLAAPLAVLTERLTRRRLTGDVEDEPGREL